MMLYHTCSLDHLLCMLLDLHYLPDMYPLRMYDFEHKTKIRSRSDQHYRKSEYANYYNIHLNCQHGCFRVLKRKILQ